MVFFTYDQQNLIKCKYLCNCLRKLQDNKYHLYQYILKFKLATLAELLDL